jgi:hypothetical protein
MRVWACSGQATAKIKALIQNSGFRRGLFCQAVADLSKQIDYAESTI